MDPRAPNQEQKPVDYEGLTSFLGVDNSFFTPWRPSSPPVDYERLTSFARPDNSFLSPWNFDPNNPSPQTSQPPQRMTFEPGSYFSPELGSNSQEEVDDGWNNQVKVHIGKKSQGKTKKERKSSKRGSTS